MGVAATGVRGRTGESNKATLVDGLVRTGTRHRGHVVDRDRKCVCIYTAIIVCYRQRCRVYTVIRIGMCRCQAPRCRVPVTELPGVT